MSDQKISFFLTSLKVYHQQHPFMRPPLNAMHAIVKNSNLFYSKWSVWPMTNHLEKFKDMGLIEWFPNGTEPIIILKRPTEFELESAIILNEPYA